MVHDFIPQKNLRWCGKVKKREIKKKPLKCTWNLYSHSVTIAICWVFVNRSAAKFHDFTNRNEKKFKI